MEDTLLYLLQWAIWAIVLAYILALLLSPLIAGIAIGRLWVIPAAATFFVILGTTAFFRLLDFNEVGLGNPLAVAGAGAALAGAGVALHRVLFGRQAR